MQVKIQALFITSLRAAEHVQQSKWHNVAWPPSPSLLHEGEAHHDTPYTSAEKKGLARSAIRSRSSCHFTYGDCHSTRLELASITSWSHCIVWMRHEAKEAHQLTLVMEVKVSLTRLANRSRSPCRCWPVDSGSGHHRPNSAQYWHRQTRGALFRRTISLLPCTEAGYIISFVWSTSHGVIGHRSCTNQTCHFVSPDFIW
jgi:hypothetical protein